MKNILLDGYYHLPDRVAIYIPTEFEKEILQLQKCFNHDFGGSTVINGVGSWNGSEGIEVEDITIIYSNVPALTDHIIQKVIRVANTIKTNCNQEAVSVAFNGEMYLI